MKRNFRLTRSTDIKRVRRSGRSVAHPLVVLYACRSDQPGVRVAVSAGRAVGNAVRRNRAKRLLRAAVTSLLAEIAPGSDLLLIARSPLYGASLEETRQALAHLLRSSGFLRALP